MYCAKGDFPHVQYAFYLHALDVRRAVKCGMASVTWCDVTANHRRAAHSIPHFTFRMPQFRSLPTAVQHVKCIQTATLSEQLHKAKHY